MGVCNTCKHKTFCGDESIFACDTFEESIVDDCNEAYDAIEQALNEAIVNMSLPKGWTAWAEDGGWEFVNKNGDSIRVDMCIY